MSSTSSLSTEFRELAEQKQFTALEERWMATVESGDTTDLPEIEVFLEAAEALLDASEKGRADVLLEFTIPLFEGRADPEKVLQLIRHRCLSAPDEIGVREKFAEVFREHYGAGSIEAEYLALAELESAPDVSKAFELLDHWMSFREGSHVFHPSGWGAGKVQAIDPALKQVTVDLEKKRNHRMSLEAMGSVLQPLRPDDFRVLELEGGDGVRDRIENDPVGLVRIIVDSFRNPMPQKEIRELLVPRYLDSKAWTRWWNRTKKKLRENGFYRIGDRSPYLVEKLEEAVSYDDELLATFEKASWSKRRTMAKKVLRDGRKDFPRAHEAIVEELRRMLEEASGAERLSAACLLERFSLRPDSDRSAIEWVLSEVDDAARTIRALEGAEEQREAVSALPRALPDRWRDVALELSQESSDPIRDTFLTLADGDAAFLEALRERVASALAGPRLKPELFIWAVRKIDAGVEHDVLASSRDLDPLTLFNRVLDLLDHLFLKSERETDPVYSDLLGKARNVLGHRKFALFHSVLDTAGKPQCRELYQRLLRADGLSEPQRIEVLDILTKRMPELTRPVDRPIWEEKSIYTTRAGLEKHREELREIMEERLPQVFEDIGRAAAFGDLRENAEYKAALEQRDMLTSKGEEMRTEIDLARVIEPEMLRDGVVTVGAKVRVKDLARDEEIVYRILGPWDGGPDEGVLNYRSPIARFFIGRRRGDRVDVELPGGTETYEILEVTSGIED